tara:strand:- start:181 stop:372 length:192 start_codon:yes stop_codon:yes gene_type:complete
MQKPDPMIPCKPGAEDIESMSNRTKWLEELYFLDGRDQIDHPRRGLFTGLSKQYQNLSSTDGY